MKAPTLRTTNVAAAVAGMVFGALVIGIIYLVRPPSMPAAPPRPTTAAQPAATVTAASTADAKAKVCNIFHQADAAIGVAINAPTGAAGPDAAKAKVGAAVVSGALALTRAVGPATPPDIARPATELADAYSGYALSTYANGNADSSAVVAATAALRQACG